MLQMLIPATLRIKGNEVERGVFIMEIEIAFFATLTVTFFTDLIAKMF
jgi:hypothetical protein